MHKNGQMFILDAVFSTHASIRTDLFWQFIVYVCTDYTFPPIPISIINAKSEGVFMNEHTTKILL